MTGLSRAVRVIATAVVLIFFATSFVANAQRVPKLRQTGLRAAGNVQ
jgi:hypothetical protein